MSDPVHKPPHYRAGEIECIDAIRSALTPEEFRGFCKGTALAYIWRERHKGGTEDIQKGISYMRWLVEADPPAPAPAVVKPFEFT